MKMRLNSDNCGSQSGMILVFMAFFLIVLMGFMALAVDIGVIATTQAQLKTVADSAALAGARQLASDRRISTTITNLSPEINAAITQAIAAGNANKVMGSPATLTSSSINIGYLPTVNPNPSTPLNSTNPLNFNSVQVTASATVPALFSAMFRSNGSVISATSTATIELDQINGFNTSNNGSPSILPIVMDQVAYNNMMNNTGGDSYSFDPTSFSPGSSTGVSTIPDGVAESVLYPVANGLAGNWGTINFGVSNNSTSTLSAQIANGITPAQMVAEFPSGFSLPHVFSANPGISAGIKSSLQSIVGQAVTVPVYDSSGGNGNNAWYNVVAVASVRIVAVNMTGSDKYVIVQPAMSQDSTALPATSNTNSWSQGGVVFLRLSR